MKQKSMVAKVVKNTSLSILFRFLLMALVFVSRSVFIRTLNEDFLGINGLYTNILSVLALADLGVNTVLMYFLYEPLANEDYEKTASLISSFRKIYYGIACAVLLVGLLMIPFLPYIIKDSLINQKELIFYYILYLINSSVSYLAVYKSTLLLADQKAYVVNFVSFLVAAVQNIAYVIVLYMTHNYTDYLLVMIIGTLLNNLIITGITNHQYRFIRHVKSQSNSIEIKKEIITSLKSVFVYRIGATVMNSTDNILISMLVSTAMVGFYSNYALITSNLLVILNFFSQAVMASLGNYNVKASNRDQENIFRTIQLIYCGIAAFCVACLLTMMNDFMLWWIHDPKYILNQAFVGILAFKLFVDIITSPNWMFREASGLFKEVRHVMTWAAMLNIILSIILGKTNGLAGIVIATTISKLCTLFWYEPRTFYKKVFYQPISRYWKYQMRLIGIAMVAIAASYGMSFFLGTGFLGCVLKIAVSGIITILVFLVSSFHTSEGKFILKIISRH